ncbi:MAG TPA: hypothetical protein VGK73_30400, partial [Polyangiaceae bacterium]
MRTIRNYLLGNLLWMLPATGHAEEAIDLAWEAPAECPRREAVQERVRELLGPALENAERPRAEGRIVQVSGRYQLTLTVYSKGEVRERTIASQSCVDLAGAAAVALGLLIRQRPAVSGDAGSADPDGTGARPTRDPPATDARKPGSPANPSATPGAKSPTGPPSSKQNRADHENAAEGDDPGAGPELQRYGSGRSIPGAFDADFILQAPLLTLDVGPLPKPGLGLGAALGVHSGG